MPSCRRAVSGSSPVLMTVGSALVIWVLLTVVAVSSAQQPRCRRVLLRELVDYREARGTAPAGTARG